MGICDSTGNEKNNNNNNINNNYKKDNVPAGCVEPISREANRIIDNKLESYICKIQTSKCLGTGFLCKIPYPNEFNLLPVLITNHHVLNRDEIINKKV